MNFQSTLFAVSISLAIMLTVSCSSDDSNEELNSSSSIKTDNNSSSSNISSSSNGNDDRDDIKNYRTVTIGEQTWMAENLNYNASSSICYDNNHVNCDKYGRLYDWETAMKVCPSGWHLPTNDEWEKLFRYVSGYKGSDEGMERDSAGKYLKAVEGWDYYDGGKDVSDVDVYGFSALPGGAYIKGLEGYIEDFKDGFIDAGRIGWWWSATEEEGNAAYFYDMFHDDDYIGHGWIFKTTLFSVRCIKN
ncbi:MAG: hypothetical protein FWC26_11660 [Fibromonadales bacterium]|nr:hypothetical protein [Fibromonadales bacterium]